MKITGTLVRLVCLLTSCGQTLVAQQGPPALDFSSFLGGSGHDSVESLAVDRFGNSYVVGYTTSPDLRTLKARDRTFAGTDDVFVSKIDSEGNLVFTTYLGGTSADRGWAIAVDEQCNIYVAGGVSGSWDFPQVKPLQDGLKGGHDAFVAKLDATGRKLLFSTLLGGSGVEVVRGITVDTQGRVVICGHTSSEDFPTLNPAQPAFGGAGPAPNGFTGEAFVAKIDTVSGSLVYSTFLGGSDVDEAYALAAAPDGGVYITGYTASPDFPAVNALQPAFAGGQPIPLLDGDAFVTKLDALGQFVWSTFLGGESNDTGSGIAVAPDGSVFVSGVTKSASFPLTHPPDYPPGSDDDVFLTKLSSDGTSMPYSVPVTARRALRSLGWGETAVAVGRTGRVYVTGEIRPGTLPLVDPLDIPPSEGEWVTDAFVAGFDGDQPIRRFSSYLAGAEADATRSIAVDPFGAVWVAGDTSSGNFPTVRPFQDSLTSAADGFVAKIGFSGTPVPPADEEMQFRATLSGAGMNPPNSSTATGDVRAVLRGNILSCEANFTGLGSPLVGALLRGPAQPDGEGLIVIPLVPDGVIGDSGKLTGTLTCGSAAMSELVNGLWYVELQTEAHPQGGLRGHLQTGNSFPPSLSYVGEQTAVSGQAITVNFQLADPETPAADLTVAASSSNDYLFPAGSLALGGSGANRTLTLTPRPDETGVSTIRLSVRDADGGIGQTTFHVQVVRTDENYHPPGVGSVVITSPGLGDTLSGVVQWSASARRSNATPEEIIAMQNRGCTPEQIASGACGIEVMTLFVNGRAYPPHFTSDVSVDLDTTTLSNGEHELVVSAWAYPDSSMLVGLVQRTIQVDNGRSPMELRAGWRELHLAPGETMQLAPRLAFTNGDEEPAAGPVTYTSDDPGVATVSPAGLVSGVAAGVTTVLSMADGRTAKTQVHVGGPAGLPHFSRDGEVLSQYDPARSLFVRTMFVLNPEELEGADGLAEEVRRAGINTLNAGFYSKPHGAHSDFESWQRAWETENFLAWSFKERTARVLGLNLLLTGDDICRTPPELDSSLNHPFGPETVQFALTKARDSGLVLGIEMVDEVTFLWGGTPTPTDGRWLGINSTFTDDAFIRLMVTMNAVPNRPAITWPVAGASGPEAAHEWMGRPEFADYATHFWALLDYRSAYHLGGYSLPQILRNMGDNVIYARQALMQRDKPQLALVGVSGPFYTKLGEGTQFVFGRDRLQNGVARPKNVIAQIMLAATAGMSGVRAYGLDTFHRDFGWKGERAKAAEGQGNLQTGADPFTVGTDRWDAMSKAFNFIAELEPVLLQRRIHALELGGDVITTAREGQNGTLVLALNLSELPASIRADLSTYHRAGDITRLRLTTAGRSEERFSGSDSDELTLAPGETVAWLLNRPTVQWQPRTVFPFGVALGAEMLNATANVPGTFTYSPAVGALLGAGRHVLTSTFVPSAPGGLVTLTETRAVEVFPATPQVSWPTPAPIAGGTPLGDAQLAASANVPGRFIYSPAAGTLLPVGEARLTVTFVPDDLVNFHRASASITLEVTNSPPVFLSLADHTIREGQEFILNIEAQDTDQPPQNLALALGPGAPNGATLTPDGVFVWTPGESDGPGVFPITVRVTDNGEPPLGAEQTFSITVLEALDITSALTRGNSSGLTVIFSLPVAADTATNPANYAVSPGVTVNSVSLIEAGKVRLHTTPIVEGQVYTLTVNGVTDTANPPNLIAANSQRTFLQTQGGITRREFHDIGGSLLSDLTGHAKFTGNQPNVTTFTTSLETPVDARDNYGVQFLGYVTALVTGDYTFYLSSDDQGALFLSTDESPANKVQIAREPEWNGSRNWTVTDRRPGQENISAPIHLEAGHRYYLEALMKEGGGGDNLAVSWRKPGDPAIINGAEPIPGEFLSGVEPLTPAAITTQPQSQTVGEHSTVTFTVTLAGTPPYDFQWYRNGEMLVGENAATLTLSVVPATLSGSTFHVICGNGLNSLRSDDATLTVIPDLTPPQLVFAEGRASLDEVGVGFSEPVDAADAVDLGRYQLSGGLTILGATLWGNQRLVILKTSPQTPGQSYTVMVNGIHDRATSRNVIAPDSQLPFTGFDAGLPVSPLPPGNQRLTVTTQTGPVTVVIPRREFHFEPAGTTYYLATTGNDAHPGSLEQPWRTFAHAVPQLRAGDCLYVREGDYQEPFVIRNSGVAGRPIIVSAYPGESVRVRPPQVWDTTGRPGSGTIILDSVRHVWIHGFEVEGYPTEYGPVPGPNNYENNCITLTGGAVGQGDGCRILNNICSKAQHCGIKDQTGNVDYLIEGNVCFDNGISSLDHGMYLPSRDARGIVVRGNATFRNSGWGLHLYPNPDHASVYNNVVFENGAGIVESGHDNTVAHNVAARNAEIAGIWLVDFGAARNNAFLNNIVVDNQNNQFDVQLTDITQSRGNVIDYSLAFPDAGFAEPAGIPWLGSNLILAAPHFEDAAANDYRLRVGSPAKRSAGTLPLLGAHAQPDLEMSAKGLVFEDG